MRLLFAPIAGALLCVAPATALAQEVRPGDRPALPYHEIERGFHAASTVGAVFYLDLPGEGGTFASGAMIGVELGYDITADLQLGLVARGQAVGAPVTYEGITDPAVDPKDARGDFYSFLAGPSLRYSFLRLADDNGLDRTFFYGRAAGGLALNRPVGILEENGLFGTAGVGVEYFTRLRHFSVGLEVGGIGIFVDPKPAYGITLLPRVAYTF